MTASVASVPIHGMYSNPQERANAARYVQVALARGFTLQGAYAIARALTAHTRRAERNR